jgi:secondary thiamine-phosphate synthase enzyme
VVAYACEGTGLGELTGFVEDSLSMKSAAFEVDTGGRLVAEITDRVEAFAREAGGDGLLHVFLPHATAGLALMETGSGSEKDLATAIEHLLPRDRRYEHRHGSPGHGRDHLLPVLVSPSLTLPVEGGRLVLGTWQSVVIVDPNRENNRRTVQLRFVEA